MKKKSLLIVHGFGVSTWVFKPLLHRLSRDYSPAELFRYPSIGLELAEIVARLSTHLRRCQPDAIIAHSLGCAATWLAVRDADWNGPIVLLAPPLGTIPLSRLIPRFLRWPFAPLIDHRALLASPDFKWPPLPGCTVRTVAGRMDFLVPLACTREAVVADATVTMHTHNSMLFSSQIAEYCNDWFKARERGGPSNPPESLS